MFPVVWGQHPGLPLLLRHQRHNFLHQQPAQNQPPELVCQLGQEPYLEVLHRQLDRPLLYLFLLLLHWCPEALRRQLDRWLLYLFLPLLHSFPEGLRHRLALLRPLCHYFLRP